jgi:hypothetical protein
MAEAAAICDALLASIPQPRVSAAEAMRDLTDAERAALLRSRDETLRVIRAETAAMQSRLDGLTAQARVYGSEFKAMMGGADHRRMREIAEWFEVNNDEVGVLKVAIAELSDFASRLEAL